MNKIELVSTISKKSGLTKVDAEKALKAFEETVIEELVSGGKVQLMGFGIFDVAEHVEKQGRNPQTGERITIPAFKTPKFKVSKLFKDAVNGNNNTFYN